MANVNNIEQFYKSFPTLSHKRNRFPWEKGVNYNMSMGYITPVCKIPVAPGVTYNLDISTVIKVAPLQEPPQDDAVFKLFAFYGPNRISWTNYPYWFGEKKNPEDPNNEQTYLVPKVTMPTSYKINEGTEQEETINGYPFNSFYDNIGTGDPAVGGIKIDAFLPRLDRQIYNNYFRNQTLENPLSVNRTDSDDDPWENMYLRKICKPRDLFTSCLPNASGTEQVEIPLGSEAPVIGNGKTIGLSDGTTIGGLALYHDGINGQNQYYLAKSDSSSIGKKVGTETNGVPNSYPELNKGRLIGLTGNPENTGMIADLSKAMGAPLEGLYQAIAYNTYQYMTSRCGNRYFEQLSSIYGVVNPEGVLQMPEFLGSTSTYVDFDTVTQTSSTSGQNTPLAHRAANGYVENYANIINKSFGEFGWIIIYAVVTHYPKYQQGVDKLMQTEDPLDLFNPIFNLMGDEPIYRSEIYAQADTEVNEDGQPINNEVFGYQKRNARWLYPVNEIHGEQRSSYAQSLDTNHFAEYYTEVPTLNKDFDKVNDNAFKRALQITDETQFICNSLITGTIDIEVPKASIPSPFPNLQIGGA